MGQTEQEDTWAARMTRREIDGLGVEINRQEFDHVFLVTRRGVQDGPDGIYAPSVYHDDFDDITIDGVPPADSDWRALRGYTGQYLYSGAVMHPSEFIGGRLAADIVDMSAEAELYGRPLLWTVTTVEVHPDEDDDEPDPAGWTILYRKVS
jgi:hypothetical protein